MSSKLPYVRHLQEAILNSFLAWQNARCNLQYRLSVPPGARERSLELELRLFREPPRPSAVVEQLREAFYENIMRFMLTVREDRARIRVAAKWDSGQNLVLPESFDPIVYRAHAVLDEVHLVDLMRLGAQDGEDSTGFRTRFLTLVDPNCATTLVPMDLVDRVEGFIN